MKNLKVTSRKIGSGTFEVSVFNNEKWEEVGTFETNHAQLHDAIDDMNRDCFEDQTMFDTEEELKEYCFNRID